MIWQINKLSQSAIVALELNTGYILQGLLLKKKEQLVILILNFQPLLFTAKGGVPMTLKLNIT